ncbi:hypothetical protein G9A89_000303 [Geosiphon pyriformis]|nr:hypothetical protein G9A89_000303 [Geosiphon pyriformis]
MSISIARIPPSTTIPIHHNLPNKGIQIHHHQSLGDPVSSPITTIHANQGYVSIHQIPQHPQAFTYPITFYPPTSPQYQISYPPPCEIDFIYTLKGIGKCSISKDGNPQGGGVGGPVKGLGTRATLAISLSVDTSIPCNVHYPPEPLWIHGGVSPYHNPEYSYAYSHYITCYPYDSGYIMLGFNEMSNPATWRYPPETLVALAYTPNPYQVYASTYQSNTSTMYNPLYGIYYLTEEPLRYSHPKSRLWQDSEHGCYVICTVYAIQLQRRATDRAYHWEVHKTTQAW